MREGVKGKKEGRTDGEGMDAKDGRKDIKGRKESDEGITETRSRKDRS